MAEQANRGAGSSTASGMKPSTGAEEAHDPVEEQLRAALAPHLHVVRGIGAGGMARVYLAREPALKRLVAVKVLSGDYAATTEGRARFEREAQAVAGLSHPNIVAIHTVGELENGTPYFIMQYVEGPSLGHRVQSEGPLSVAEARRVLGEVAAALAAAHQQKIIHRDIKPANILYEEATGRSLVSDFGIAAVGAVTGAGKESMRLTGTGVMVGTPMYMSPEQLLAEPVSDKTDIYSLGLLAHELLTGVGPFQASSPHELIAAYLRDTPQRLSRLRPDVDTELDELVARCLEKDASKRPTADEVARRLSPGGAMLLEWPAPGLEELHGKLRPVTKAYLGGAVLIVTTIVSALNYGPGLESVSAAGLGMFVLVVSIAGLLMLLLAVGRTMRLGNLVTRALRAGYGAMTVLETLSDSRGDTGNIISASREYAALDATRRDRVRRNRVLRESLFFLGGFLALPLLVGELALGAAGVVAVSTSWVAFGLPAVAVLAGLVLAERERSAFLKARRRKVDVSRKDALRLAGPWYESFESVRAGQRLGRGLPVSAYAGRAVAIGAAALAAVLALALVPLMLVGAAGPSFWSVVLPKFSNTRQKLFIVGAARTHRLRADSAITPLAAGRAYYSLLQASGDSNRVRSPFVELPLPAPPLPVLPWSGTLPEGLFPTARWDQNKGLPATQKIMAAARAGFTPAELSYLERIAHAPHWQVADVMARAPRMDYIGARFKVPFPEAAVAWEFPVPRFAGFKSMAYASIARAAYYLARNQRDSAEAALRLGVSMGFVLVDNGTFLIDQLIGIVMVAIARDGLIDYYRTIGDPRGAQLRSQTDSLIAIVDARADLASTDVDLDTRNPVSARRSLIRVTENTKEMRGLRYELLHTLAIAPCTNVRELVFGPDPEVLAAFDHARKNWARFQSDTAFLDMVFATPERLESLVNGTTRGRMLVRAAGMAGEMLGNKRLAGCASLLVLSRN